MLGRKVSAGVVVLDEGVGWHPVRGSVDEDDRRTACPGREV
jgi:hypothetical protein